MGVDKMKSRKVLLFILTLVVLVVMAILGKDTASIVALYGTYCAGNVGAKFGSNVIRHE